MDEENIVNQLRHNPQNQCRSFDQVFGKSLYQSRLKNDALLHSIINYAIHNNQIRDRSLKSTEILKLLQNWKQSGKNIQNIGLFLHNYANTMSKRTQDMSLEIDSFKGCRDLQQIDFEREMEQKVQMQNLIKLLEEDSNNLKDIFEFEVNQMKEQNLLDKKIVDSIMMIKDKTIFIELQRNFNNQQLIKIMTIMNKESPEEAEKQYYSHLQQIADHYHQRNHQLFRKMENIRSQIQQITVANNKLKNQKIGANVRKQSIIQKSKKLESLKIEFSKLKEKKQITLRKKNSLQQKYCESEMQKVINKYMKMDHSTCILLQKAISLMRDSLNSISVEYISKLTENYIQKASSQQ